MSLPLIISGIVYDDDGTTPIDGAICYVYNKDLDEEHNGYDSLFPELKTNSAGEYQINLANFTGDWGAGDEVWISAFYGQKSQCVKVTVSTNVDGIDLTLKELEPVIAISKLLQIKLTDYNSTRNNTIQYIRPEYGKREMTKTDYPVIYIKDVDESSESLGIGNQNNGQELTTHLKITIAVWDKTNDAHKLTISGSSYVGTKLRDYLTREVLNVFRKEFNKSPSYNINAIVNKFYDYQVNRVESVDFDEVRDNGIMKKEIDILIKTIKQDE